MLRTPHAAFALLLLVTGAIYLPGLTGPLVLDDRNNLAPVADVAAGRVSAWRYLFEPGAGGVPRPLPKLTFLVNYWTSGEHVPAYKAVNLVIHLLTGVLVYALAWLLADGYATPRERAPIALLSAGLWLLAPLQVSTVLYVVQRMAQLAAALCLAALVAYVLGRRAATPRGRAAGLAIAFGLLWPAALLSKQNAAVVPALALLIETFVGARWLQHRPARNALGAALALGVLALAALVAIDPAWLLGGYSARDFDLWQRLITQARVLWAYLGNLMLLPFATPMGLYHDDFVVSRSLLDPPTTLVGVLGLTAVAAAVWRSRGTRHALLGLGVGMFLVAHAVESSIFPLELYFEHRNYLPSAGLFLGLSAGVVTVARRLAAPRAWTALIAAALIASAALTAIRVGIWRSEHTLYASSVEQHPRSARAHLALASLRFNDGDLAAGEAHLETASTLLPASATFGVALHALAAHCARGIESSSTTRALLERAPVAGSDFYTVNAMQWMSGALDAGRCVVGDRERLARALERVRGRRVALTTPERDAARSRALVALDAALARRLNPGAAPWYRSPPATTGSSPPP